MSQLILSWLLLAAADAPDFARDIRPILAARCFECHDGRKQTAGLRLDLRDSALRGGESGERAVVPGDPAASELVRRIVSQDDGERMPPEGEPLPAEQVELLSRWIASGAVWPDALAGEGRCRR